jgi:hypothetical protein
MEQYTLMQRIKMGVRKNYVDYKKGRKNSHEDPRRQKISTEYGNNGAEQTRRYVGEEKVTDADRRAFQESLQQHDFSKVNAEVAETEGMENRNFGTMFKEVYHHDTGRNADDDWEKIPENVANSVKKGIEKTGDVIQKIPDPVLSGAGFVAGGVAIVGSGGVVPVAAGVGYVASGLAITKTYLDVKEGKKSKAAGYVDYALQAGSTGIPYAGPLIDGGQFLYDTIKYNYGNRYDMFGTNYSNLK